MNDSLFHLSLRITDELQRLGDVVERIKGIQHDAKDHESNLYLDAMAFNLHSFYTGFEKLFERIARTVDDNPPQGSGWHRRLLLQMTREVPHLRPAVISEDTHEKLDKYRAFRHVVRNIYAHDIDLARLSPLVDALEATFAAAKRELDGFAAFLRYRAKDEPT